MSYLASNLVYLRKIKGVTQSEIQDRLGFVRNTQSNWENERTEPSVDQIVQYADYFNVGLSDLIKTDMSKGKVIENDTDTKKHQKGKVNGKANGKVNTQNAEQSGIVREPDAPYGNTLTTPPGTIKAYTDLLAEKQQIIDAQALALQALQMALKYAQAQHTAPPSQGAGLPNTV